MCRTNVTYNGDATTLCGVRVTYNGNDVASESGPYADCTQVPSGTLTSTCVQESRVWTVNASQTGAYVAEFVINGSVVASTPLDLVANTDQTFTYSGDATSLSLVRVTFNGTTVAQETGPYETCAPPPAPPNASLAPQCTDEGLVWNVLTDRTGTYTAQVLSNGQVIDSVTLNLTANTPQQFTFTADSTKPNQIRLIYENATVVTRAGSESCVSGVNASLLRQCVGTTLVWSVQSNTTGSYTAQLVGGTTVVENQTLNLVSGVEQQFSFTEEAYSPRFVRLLFQGNQYAVLQGPTERCTPTSLPETEEPTGRTFANYLYLPTLRR